MASSAIVIILIGLLVVDAFTGGAVSGGINDILFGDAPEDQEKRCDLMCLTGIALFEPSEEYEVVGKTIRLPHFTLGDLFMGLFMATLVIFGINMIFGGSNIGVAKVIVIVIGCMVFIKIVGWMLITGAGPECSSLHTPINEKYVSALEAGAAGGAGLLALKLMKMKKGV